jgi:integrase
MSRANLFLVPSSRIDLITPTSSFVEKLADHNAIITGYKDTYRTRNFSEKTIKNDFAFITTWFEGTSVVDDAHPDGERQLLLWEAMKPISGRQRIIEFSKGLCALGLRPTTRRDYLGILRRLFAYTLEWPYIPESLQSIASKYGPIEQPVLAYDYPVNAADQDQQEGWALIGDELIEFYCFIKSEFIPRQQKKLSASRDYVMIVLAGESGLRADELRNLDAYGPHRDLYFKETFIQTRSGKGTRGSGKRIRRTIFTDFAQCTTSVYLEHIRSHFLNAETEPALFLAENGSRISYSTMARNLKIIVAAAREAGLEIPPSMGWHGLRRSFATNIVDQDPSRIWELMGLLGHSNPSTVNRYLKFKKNHFIETRTRVVQRFLRSEGSNV